MNTILRTIAVVLGSLTLCGCSGLDYLAMKTAQLFQPPPKTKPLYSLEGKSVLILVDVADENLAERSPHLSYKIARAVARELSDQRAAASIVNPRDLVTYARTEADFARKSAVDIGRDFDVDLVLHAVVQAYHLDGAAGSDTYNGMVGLGLRVIDVAEGKQVFPDFEQLHLIDVRSPSGITADGRTEAEKILFDGLALDVGKVFVAYEIDSLPRNPQVK